MTSWLRTRPAYWSVALLGAVLVAMPAAAQFNSQQVRQRYDRQTKGSGNLSDAVKKLGSAEAEVRLEGVKNLGETKDSEAIAYLIQALGDTDPRVKCKAIDLLGNRRADDATPVLVQHLFLRTTDHQLKHRIVATLGEIGDPRAAKPIVEFLQRDLDNEVRGTAIFALGEIGAPEALDSLTEMAQAETNPTLRRLANEAAAKVRRHQAVLSREAKEPGATFLEPEQPQQAP